MLVSFVAALTLAGQGTISKAEIVGTWHARYEHFRPNSMEAGLHKRYRLSIFADGNWDERILRVTKGNWITKDTVLILKGRSKQSYRTGETRLIYDKKTRELVSEANPATRFYRTSRVPVHLVDAKNKSV